MPELWNVAVPVIACLTAETGEEAERKLRRALEQAGFEPLEAVSHALLTPFVAEDGTEPSGLPAALAEQ